MPADEAYPLRFYAQPLKVIALFLMMAGVCALAVWLALSPNVPPGGKPAAFFSIPLFGYGAIAYLTLVVQRVIMGRPLLEIDARGWAYAMPFTLGERSLPWDNIASIALFYTPWWRYSPAALPHCWRQTA
jgi:hypothetical protein